ncbi:MAG TPA: hypothetical protein ENJ44_00485, partial [Oceanospirillales bacterium]|nr:hypothetical protein [Oceanospirillales bacterium]
TKEAFYYDDLNRLTKTNRYINSNYGAINQVESNAYDTTGNLTKKIWVNQSYNDSRPHALSSVGSTNYIYDGNGNLDHTTGGTTNKTLHYYTFDKPYQITQTGTKYHQSNFRYDGNHARYYRKDIDNNAQTTTKYYLGNVEKITKSGTTTFKRYIGANLVITLPYANASQNTWDFDYLFKTHIGSTDVITDKSGNIKHSLGFNSWGQRQNISTLGTYALSNLLNQFQSINNISDRGYTGHEQLDGLGLIHMNGRIYDPTIGRFLQADPNIQDPYNTQSLNRYTYVLNNPLTLTDPTGYFSFSRFWKKSGRTIAAIVVTIFTNGAAAGWYGTLTAGQTYAVIFAGGFIAGGIQTGNFKGAVKGGIFSTVTYGIAHGGAGGKGWIKEGINRTLTHAALAGMSSMLDGDSFGHGFAASLLSIGADAKYGEFLKTASSRIIANALFAGTISEITGGKFASGALSAAFRVAFNELAGKTRIQMLKEAQQKREDIEMTGGFSPLPADFIDADGIIRNLTLDADG